MPFIIGICTRDPAVFPVDDGGAAARFVARYTHRLDRSARVGEAGLLSLGVACYSQLAKAKRLAYIRSNAPL
jgi:hypothetical protein